MTNQVIPIEGVDTVGVIKDTPSILLPPNAFSDARNVRFDNGAIRKMEGQVNIFDTDRDDITIQAIQYWPNPNDHYYLIVGRDTDSNDRIYLVSLNSDGSSTTTDISDTDYSSIGTWRFTVFNGGYSVVANNGIDNPRYITDVLRENAPFNQTFAELPNWHSYTVDSDNSDTDTDVVPSVVRADIIVANGNLLLAGALTEYSASNSIIRNLGGVVRSSDVAAPGNIPQNWNPFSTGVNTADELILADTGIITAMNQLQGNIYVYTSDSIHRIQVTNQGLRSDPITNQYGALSQEAVFEFDGKHLVIGSNDIYLFGGNPGNIQSVADKRIRQYFYDNLHPVSKTVFIERNLNFDEIWIHYATLESVDGEANEVIIWNYRDNTWTIRDITDIVGTTVGPIPGGSVAGSRITFTAPDTDTDRTGQFGICDEGIREDQRMTISGNSLNGHEGITQLQVLEYDALDQQYDFDAREEFDLFIENEDSGTAQPNLVHAVSTITFPTFTPNSNNAVAGGTRLVINGTNPSQVTIDGLSLNTYTNLATYILAVRDLINNNGVAGYEDYTAETTADDPTIAANTIRLTSDIMGPRTLTSATLTTYTGTTVAISGTGNTNGIVLNRTPNTPATVNLTGTAGTVAVPFVGGQPTWRQGTGNNVASATGNTVASQSGARTDRSENSNAQMFVGGYRAFGTTGQINQDLNTSYTVQTSGTINIVAVGSGSGAPDSGQQGRAGGWGHFTYLAEAGDVINMTVAASVPADGNFSGNGGASSGFLGRNTRVRYTRGGSLLWEFNSGRAPAAQNNGGAVVNGTSSTLTGGSLPTTVALGSIANNSANTTANRQGYWAAQSGINSPTLFNRNAFQLQNGGWGHGAYSGGNLAWGHAAPGAVGIWQAAQSYDWSVTNNRDAATYPLQQDVFNFTGTVGGSTLNFGNVDANSTSDTINIPDADFTMSWTANVFGTSSNNFNQQTANSASTKIGTVNITRASTSPLAGPSGSGTGSGSSGGIIVTQTGTGSVATTVTTGAITGGTQRNVTGLQAGDRLHLQGLSGGSTNMWTGTANPGSHNFNTSGGGNGSASSVVRYVLPSGTNRINNLRPGGDVSGAWRYTVTRLSSTFNFRVANTNSYSVTFTSGPFSGTTIPANDFVDFTSLPSNAWSFTSNNIPQYSYSATVDENQGPATITHADGSDITDVSLTTTAQTFVTATPNPTINVQGNYTTVSGTATDVPINNPVLVTNGNGVYGYEDTEAPTVSLRIQHTGSKAFDVRLNPFPDGAVTTEAYRDFLLDELPLYVQFSAPSNPRFHDTDYDSDVVFYIEQSQDDPLGVRFINVDTEDHDPVSFTFETILDGTEYGETQFGGNVDDELTARVVGRAGAKPPILNLHHPSTGTISTLLYGSYMTAASVARGVYFAIRNTPGFTFTYSIEDSDTEILIERDLASSDNVLFTQSFGSDTDSERFTGKITQTRAGVDPSDVGDILVFHPPDGLPTFEVDLSFVGDPNSTLTPIQIAEAIKDQFDSETMLDSDLGFTWDLAQDSEVLTFTSKFDVRQTIENGVLDQETLVAGTTPGYTGQDLGRSADTDWYYTVMYGETGTQTLDNPIMDTEAITDTEGVDPSFSQSGYIQFVFQDESFYAIKVDNQLVDAGSLQAYEEAATIPFFQASYDGSENSFLLEATDLSGSANTTIDQVNTYPGTLLSDCSLSVVNITDNTTVNTDPYRPWPSGEFNDAKQFIILADKYDIHATDIGYSIRNLPYDSYVERKRIHMAPTKDVEYISGMYIDAETDNPQTLYLDLDVTDVPNDNPTLTADNTAPYSLDIQDEYKVDVRKTGRLLSYRLGANTNERWIVSSFGLDVGKKGQR